TRGRDPYGADTPRFGWWGTADVGAAFLRTPPHPVLLERASVAAAAALAQTLVRLDPAVPAVNATPEAAEAFARDWCRRSRAAVPGPVAGVFKVAPVYTPPQRRRHGYGGAVTAAVSRAALDAGATDVVLYTDLANPTSNSVYQRLGYRPVHDRVVLSLVPARRAIP